MKTILSRALGIGLVSWLLFGAAALQAAPSCRELLGADLKGFVSPRLTEALTRMYMAPQKFDVTVKFGGKGQPMAKADFDALTVQLIGQGAQVTRSDYAADAKGGLIQFSALAGVIRKISRAKGNAWSALSDEVPDGGTADASVPASEPVPKTAALAPKDRRLFAHSVSPALKSRMQMMSFAPQVLDVTVQIGTPSNRVSGEEFKSVVEQVKTGSLGLLGVVYDSLGKGYGLIRYKAHPEQIRKLARLELAESTVLSTEEPEAPTEIHPVVEYTLEPLFSTAPVVEEQVKPKVKAEVAAKKPTDDASEPSAAQKKEILAILESMGKGTDAGNGSYEIKDFQRSRLTDGFDLRRRERPVQSRLHRRLGEAREDGCASRRLSPVHHGQRWKLLSSPILLPGLYQRPESSRPGYRSWRLNNRFQPVRAETSAGFDPLEVAEDPAVSFKAGS